MSPNGVSEGVMQVVVHISPPSTGTPYIRLYYVNIKVQVVILDLVPFAIGVKTLLEGPYEVHKIIRSSIGQQKWYVLWDTFKIKCFKSHFHDHLC